jgi:rare lipoprotein A
MLKSLALAGALLCAAATSHAEPTKNFLAGIRSIDIVMTRDPPAETCTASQYGVGDGYHGKRAADGSIFNTHALTAAHKTRKFGSRVTVTNLANGLSVTVRITDRGPFIKGRCIDLSRAGANAIGMGGLAKVRVE